jgi:cell division protein FtsI (penicillin-binding protein 3)
MKMTENKDIYWRAYLIYFGFVVLMLVVIFKTVSIQFEDGTPMFMSSMDGKKKMPTRTVQRTPRRGQILDANHIPLVTSVSYYNIYMDPTVVDQNVFDGDLGQLCQELSALFPNSSAIEYEGRIRTARARGSRYLLIHKKATNEERKKLHEMPIFKLGRFKGGLIDTEENIERKRPYGELLRRTLGYVDWIEQSKEWKKVGIEGAFDSYLVGEPGEEIEQKISTGWKKIGPITKEAVEGATVVTSIDVDIQDVAHTELLNQLKSQSAEKGCVIVMDVKTGFIKAMVNLRKGDDGVYYESFNQAIGEKEVPGSTFKLASLMAALEDGKIRLTDKVNAKGKYTFYGRSMTDSNYGNGYGEITIQKAFEKSSNVFTEIINSAYRSNPDAFIRRLKKFGLDKKLGIALSGEAAPVMYEPGDPSWSGLSLPWMAVGYEFQQTPLQTLAFYNAVANNGELLKPQFVEEVYRGNELIQKFEKDVMIPKICTERTIKDLHKCLEGVVKRGTGKTIGSAYFDIAGKTGTAHILDEKNSSTSEKKYQASFVGYFPAQDPIYSCIVVVSAPTKNIYGAVVSGTVFTAIANKVYASSLKYHKPVNVEGETKTELPISMDGNSYDLTQSYRVLNIPYRMEKQTTWVNTKTKTGHVDLLERYVGKKTVPNVIGMTAKDAVFLLERTGLKAKIEGYGMVTHQSLNPGEEVVRGKSIQIKLN